MTGLKATGTGSFQPKALKEVGTVPEGCGDVPEKKSTFISFYVAFDPTSPIFTLMKMPLFLRSHK
jgi:hypothetical protein